jgi:hypothetical protein
VTDDQYAELIRVHQFEHGGFRTGEVRAEPSVGATNLHGKFFEGDEEIGAFSVIFFRTGKGRIRAFIQTVRIDPRIQGSGLSTAFVRHLEKEYARGGIHTLEFSVSEIGAYSAARRYRGFAFTGDEQQQALGIWNDHGEEALAEAQEKGGLPAQDAEDVRAFFRNVELGKTAPPAPWDIAELGDKYRWDDEGREMWLGKRVLIGSRWTGTKTLRKP